TIESITRGKNKITWKTKRFIELPVISDSEIVSSNQIPSKIISFLIQDEQCLLSIVNYLNLIDLFIGEKSFHILSHWRTTYNSIQVEIDSLYLTTINRIDTLIPVEAKIHAKEKFLTKEQILSHIKTVSSKYPDYNVLSVAIVLQKDNSILMFLFEGINNNEEIKQIKVKKYQLNPAIWNKEGKY
ncbi:unnamed protein product, partial [marine sediment metagenome]